MLCRKCNKEIPEDAVFCHLCGTRQAAAERKHRKRPNGSGTIAKLAGGRSKPWMARKAGILIGTYATRNEAQKALERLTDTGINSKYNMTFSQIYDAWLPEHSRTISKSATATYKAAYKNAEALHDRQFRTLRRSDFQSVIIKDSEYYISLKARSVQIFLRKGCAAVRSAFHMGDQRGNHSGRPIQKLHHRRKAKDRGNGHPGRVFGEDPYIFQPCRTDRSHPFVYRLPLHRSFHSRAEKLP